ncbi:MAG: ABC transporter ATP-binding protein [Acidobacteriota bacterium]
MKNLFRFRHYLRPYAGTILAGMLFAMVAAISTATVAGLLKPMFNDVFYLGGKTVSQPVAGQAGLPGARQIGTLGERLDEWHHGLERSVGSLARGYLGYDASRAYLYVPVFFVFAFLGKSLFGFFSSYRLGVVGLRVVQDLRSDLYEQIQRQSLKFFSAHPTGLLISRLTHDVSVLQSTLGMPSAEIVRLSFSLVFLFLAAMLMDWRLCLICTVVLPVTIYPATRFARKIKHSTSTSQSRLADLADRLQETIVGRRVVRSFNTEGYEINRFRALLGKMLRAERKAIKYMALTQPVIAIIGAVVMALLAGLAGWRIHDGRLDPGDFVATLAALYWMYAILRKLARVGNEMTRAAAAADRVFEIVDLEPEIVESPKARNLDSFREAIQFEGVHFSYIGAPVLAGVDLTIRKGEKVAVVGASGAGKTTLVNLVPRFYDVTRGRVTIDGQDVRDLTLKSLRAQIGLVTQEIILFNDSVKNNIAYGFREAEMEKIIAAARAAHAHDFITALPEGYDTPLGEAGQSLSVGQRQRIAIARAILKGAPILILDEATSALDTESETQVQAALNVLMRERTAIIIAHRLETVRSADRIVVLEKGCVAEIGSHDQLLGKNGVYARLHQLQPEAVGMKLKPAAQKSAG